MNTTNTVSAETLAYIQRARSAASISVASEGVNTLSDDMADDPQFKALNEASENLSRVLARINDEKNPATQAEIKAAYEKYQTAKGVLIHKINGMLSSNTLSEAKRAELVAILKTHLGVTPETVDLEENQSSSNFNDLVKDIISNHKNNRFDPLWLAGLEKYVGLSNDVAELTSLLAVPGIVTTVKSKDGDKIHVNTERILEKLREIYDKWRDPKNAIFKSDKTGPEALKEVQEVARTLGLNDAYSPSDPNWSKKDQAIRKITNEDGTVTYMLTPNLGPVRQMLQDVSNAPKEMNSADYNRFMATFDAQKDILKTDVTTFSTKTGDEKTKLDNLVKALMASLSSRQDNGKNFLT